REDPAVQEVAEKPEHLGAVAPGGEERAEQVRQAHAGEPQPLTGREQRGQGQGREEAPEQPAADVHGVASAARGWGRTCRESGFSPCRRFCSVSAALISPTWL